MLAFDGSAVASQVNPVFVSAGADTQPNMFEVWFEILLPALGTAAYTLRAGAKGAPGLAVPAHVELRRSSHGTGTGLLSVALSPFFSSFFHPRISLLFCLAFQCA